MMSRETHRRGFIRRDTAMLEHVDDDRLGRAGLPAGGPAAAVGVVAVGQADGRAVAGDVAGIAFNAQAVTITAQIVAAEASGRSAGGTGVSVAGRTPALRSARRAAAGGTDIDRTGGRHAGRARCPTGPGRPGMAAVRGGRGPDPDGPAGVRDGLLTKENRPPRTR